MYAFIFYIHIAVTTKFNEIKKNFLLCNVYIIYIYFI